MNPELTCGASPRTRIRKYPRQHLYDWEAVLLREFVIALIVGGNGHNRAVPYEEST